MFRFFVPGPLVLAHSGRMFRFFVPGPLPGLNEIVDACKGCGGKGYGYAAMRMFPVR